MTSKKISLLLKASCLGVSLIAGSPLANASSYQQLTIDETTQKSELIFEGLVEDVSYRIPPDRQSVYTFVTFKIIDVLKGTYAQSTLELRYPGGELNGIGNQVTDMVIPKVGEQGIYFVNSLSEHFVHPLTGWAQGQMNIVKDAQGKKRIYSTEGAPIQAIGASLTAKKQAINLDDHTPDVATGVVTGGTALTSDEAKQQLLLLIQRNAAKGLSHE